MIVKCSKQFVRVMFLWRTACSFPVCFTCRAVAICQHIDFHSKHHSIPCIFYDIFSIVSCRLWATVFISLALAWFRLRVIAAAIVQASSQWEWLKIDYSFARSLTLCASMFRWIFYESSRCASKCDNEPHEPSNRCWQRQREKQTVIDRAKFASVK